MARPTSLPHWTAGEPEKVLAPDSSLLDRGYIADEQPDARHFNYLFYMAFLWIKHLDEITTNISGTQDQYDAYVGPGGTHADFNALGADADIANIRRVFVRNSLALTTTQIIDFDNVEIVFANGAVVTNADDAGTAFRISSNRITLTGARFTNWSNAGDVPIELTNVSKNCVISNCSFFACQDTIQDASDSNHKFSNFVEVA